jgi:hypothetical protein
LRSSHSVCTDYASLFGRLSGFLMRVMLRNTFRTSDTAIHRMTSYLLDERLKLAAQSASQCVKGELYLAQTSGH